MRKLGFLIATLLILTGCSFTSTYTISGDGTVTGTSTFGVPKSALPKVTTIDQWKTILDSNNFPAPTDSPSPTPSQSASCAPGEDNVLGQWTYACSVSGDISALNGAISASGSSDMSFSRAGQTLTISQAPSSTSSDSDNPFGINGVTLFFITTTLTVPGSVTSVSGNATKVNDNTVKFETDESQTDISTATVTLPEMSTTATSVSLTAKVMNSLPNQSDVSLSASMATPVPGVIEFFDGETSLGKAELGLDGKAEFIAIGQSDGSHSYQAKFLPNNWWSYDQSTDVKTISLATFRFSSNPKISGTAKVGSKLSVASIKSTPTPTKISYQWLRGGKAIAGATKSTYVVGASDYKKILTVRVVVSKKDYQSMMIVTNSLLISKR